MLPNLMSRPNSLERSVYGLDFLGQREVHCDLSLRQMNCISGRHVEFYDCSGMFGF